MIRSKPAAFVWAAALLCAAVPRAAADLPAETIAQVEKAITTEMSKQGIPGLSAAIVVNHQLAWSKGFGLADVENEVSVRPDTVFRIASLSKPITATAVMHLVEKGQIDLDAPIPKYVPGLPEKLGPITTRQLLAHLSGIRHYRGQDERLSMRHYNSLSEALAIFKDDPLLFEPGTKYSYTTYGYSLLGCVVEGASRQKFPDYVYDQVCKPAGMERTRADDIRELVRHRVHSYVKAPGGELRNAPPIDPSNKFPGGGIRSTAGDMARFAIALQTGILLKKQTFEQMCVVQKTSDGTLAGGVDGQGQFQGQSLGWLVLKDQRGRQVVRAGGTQAGVRVLLHMVPGERFAVVLMSNLSGVDIDRLARQIADIVLPAEGKPAPGASGRPDEWPQYKGNAGFTGVSPDRSVRPPLKLLWSYRLDGDASYDAGGGVIVAGGKVFVPVYNTRSLVALDADTGRFVWKYDDYQASIRKVPSYSNGRLILWDCVAKKSTVLALDAATGKLLWQRSLQAEGSDPNRAGLPVLDGKVFCSEGGDEPAVIALDEKTGREVWRTPLGKEDGLSVVCPTAAGGKVFVATLSAFGFRRGEYGAVIALDASNGKVLWRRKNIFPYKTLVSDGRVVACPMFGKEDAKHRKFFLLDAQTGETLWIGADRFHYSPATVTEDLVLIKPYGGTFVAVDRKTGKELWQFNGQTMSGCCTPVISGAYAYLGTGVVTPGDVESIASFQRVDAPREKGLGGTLFAVDLKTGKPVWQFSTGNTICGEPAIAYGRLYFAGRDGRVYCFAPAQPGELTVPEARDRSAPASSREVEALLAPKLLDRPRPGRDWPMQGGSPDRAGLEGVSLKPPLALAWKLDTGGRIVTAAAVWEGLVFAGSESGKLLAVDLKTGRKAWEFQAGAPVRCSPAAAGGLVYCGSDAGVFHALDARTGEKKWSFETGGPVQAAPALVGGIVVFGANDHHVYALDRFTGRKLWSFRMNNYSIQAPPVVHGDQVFVGQWTDWVWALDLKTGKVQWRSFLPVSIEAVAWHRDRVYVRNPYWIIELDPRTGKRLRYGSASYGYGGIAFAGNRLFLSGVRGQYGTTGATATDLDAPGSPINRKIPTLEDVLQLHPKALKGSPELASMGTPLVLGDKVCFATLSGQLILAEADGTRLWTHQLGAPCHATPVAADGTLIVGSDDGMLYAFREK